MDLGKVILWVRILVDIWEWGDSYEELWGKSIVEIEGRGNVKVLKWELVCVWGRDRSLMWL